MKNSSFVSLSSPYHSFDPRAKMIFTVLMGVVCFLPLSWESQCILTLGVVILSLSMVGWKNTLHSLSLILPILIMMTLFMPLQGRSGEVVWRVGSVNVIYGHSLFIWQRILNRFLVLSLLCSLLSQTTRSNDIILALRFFRLPYSVALVISMALRLIPTIAGTFQEIRESQKLRLPNPGVEEKGRRKLTSIIPTLVSVIVVSMKSISSLSQALELRGYGRENRRSSYKILKSVKKVFPHFIISAILPAIIAFALISWR